MQFWKSRYSAQQCSRKGLESPPEVSGPELPRGKAIDAWTFAPKVSSLAIIQMLADLINIGFSAILIRDAMIWQGRLQGIANCALKWVPENEMATLVSCLHTFNVTGNHLSVPTKYFILYFNPMEEPGAGMSHRGVPEMFMELHHRPSQSC